MRAMTVFFFSCVLCVPTPCFAIPIKLLAGTQVKISVENSSPKLSILIDPQEFLPKLSLLKDEMMKLKSAIDGGRQYELPVQHDPIFLMFDNDFLLGNKCALFVR